MKIIFRFLSFLFCTAAIFLLCQSSRPAGTGCVELSVSEDGFWVVDGVRSDLPYASEKCWTPGPEGLWLLDGKPTDKRFAPRTKGLVCRVKTARKIKEYHSDGTVKVTDRPIDWGMYVEKTEKNLYIYVGRNCSENWVKYKFAYRFKNVDNPKSYPNHLDNWGLGQPSRCTLQLPADAQSKPVFKYPDEPELFLAGESEAAMLCSAPDGKFYHTGGVLHGWENLLTDENGKRLISIRIDGTEIEEKSVFKLSAASVVEIEQRTRVAHPYGDPIADQFAIAVKKWKIADGTVSITCEYQFTAPLTVKQAMFGMLCVKRLDMKNEDYRKTGADLSRGYVSRFASKDNDPFNMYAMPEGWEKRGSESYNERSSKALGKKDIETRRIEEYGEKGWTFALQLDSCVVAGKEFGVVPKGGFKIGTNGNNYNKIYFDICGERDFKAGESMVSKVHWEIDNFSDYK